MTPEEQLEDLQRRFQLLEGERKATFETAQLNIKQNKETTERREQSLAKSNRPNQVRVTANSRQTVG